MGESTQMHTQKFDTCRAMENSFVKLLGESVWLLLVEMLSEEDEEREESERRESKGNLKNSMNFQGLLAVYFCLHCVSSVMS